MPERRKHPRAESPFSRDITGVESATLVPMPTAHDPSARKPPSLLPPLDGSPAHASPAPTTPAQAPPFLAVQFAGNDSIIAGFTTASGGFSAGAYSSLNLGDHVGDSPDLVQRNRERVSQIMGMRLSFTQQVHGAAIHHVTGAFVDGSQPPAPHLPHSAPTRLTPRSISRADAQVTTMAGVGLAVMVADCVPLLLADSEQGIVAVAHAGRPGLFRDVVPRTVTAMRELGADRIEAVVGPSICGSCYEVPEDMIQEAARISTEIIRPTPQGTRGIDIAAGVRVQLRAVGVEAIRTVEVCTAEDPRFFSHRGHGGQPTGRFAGVIGLNQKPRETASEEHSTAHHR